MWAQSSQSMLLQLLFQANAFNLLCLLAPTLAAPITSLQTQPNGTTAQVLNKRHRIVARRSDYPDKLIMPIDLSILRSIPDLPVDDLLPENPVIFAVDIADLHGRTGKPDPDPRSRHRGDAVRNDIVLIPDLTLPARIKNDYSQPHRLSARVASIGNDRIPVLDHLHSSYRQGHSPKDALWDFLEYQMDEDNNLVPGKSEDDYPDDYGSEEDAAYWYSQGRHEDEYEGSDNKIKSPPRQFREKKNVFVSESWRPGGHTQIRPESPERSRIDVSGGKTKGSRTPFTKDIPGQTSVFGLSSWRPGGKRFNATLPPAGDRPNKASWSGLASRWTAITKRDKKHIFFTKGWGPGGNPYLPPRKEEEEERAQGTRERAKEEQSVGAEGSPHQQQQRPPWRRPKSTWGVPHLFGPYW